MSSSNRLTRFVILLLFLTAIVLAFTPAVSAQTTSKVTVSTSVKGAKFRVDGQTYVVDTTFDWPSGSKHVLEFPVSVELGGLQYSDLFNARYTFSGWADNQGLLSPAGDLVQVVTAHPAVTSLTANISVEYLVQLVWYQGLVTPPDTSPTLSPSSCGAPSNPVPAEFRVGVVYVDGTCYWNNVELWMSAGTHTLNAFPYPGFVFIGWLADTHKDAYLRTFDIQAPITVVPRFSPAKRVNFRTDPPGLAVMVDSAAIRTTSVEPCEPNNLLPPGAPSTSKQACVGEFDFAPDSKHTIGAVSPQVDMSGRTWVFTGFSNGMGQNATYTTGPTAFPEDNLLATFVRGTPVSITTKPAGLALQFDNNPATNATYTFFAAGTKHSVTAPAEQTASNGRKYRFKRWSNGGPATQEFTVPASPDLSFILEAEYELLNRVSIDANVSGISFLVDGEACPAPCQIDRLPGAQVVVEPPPMSPGGEGEQFVFDRWADNQPLSRTLTIPASDPPALHALYSKTYRLLTAIDPTEGGRIAVSPSSPNGYYKPDTVVSLRAEPADGYKFRRWDYALQGTDPVASLTMAGPRSIAARFDKIQVAPTVTIRSAAGQTPDGVVAPGSLISIFGTNLAATYEVGPTRPFLAQTIGGVSVTVGNRILPLLFVSPDQINAQLPRDLAAGDYELIVVRVGAQEQRGKFRVEATAPGLFSQVVDELAYAAAQHEDGAPVTLASPAKPGESITLLATGLGAYRFPVREGMALPTLPAYTAQAEVAVLVGPADARLELEWAGGQPGQAGMDLIRFKVPADDRGPGPWTIRIAAADRMSNSVLLPIAAQ
ncbi:MAG: hypothetical protein IT168_25375 [Bryobacterales bacterium]|nr:hypothetical protein [Bryobacterales bacterium]